MIEINSDWSLYAILTKEHADLQDKRRVKCVIFSSSEIVDCYLKLGVGRVNDIFYFAVQQLHLYILLNDIFFCPTQLSIVSFHSFNVIAFLLSMISDCLSLSRMEF